MEIDPILCSLQTFRRQRAMVLSAEFLATDQTRIFENPHVLRDGRCTDVIGSGEFANGRRAIRQLRQDASARTVGQREINSVEFLKAGFHAR